MRDESASSRSEPSPPEGSLEDAARVLEEREPLASSSDLLQRLADQAPTEPRYEAEGEIARGGMGAILRVWDANLRRALAMKVILRKVGARDEGPQSSFESRTLSRFLEEAQITGQLDHPGIVPVHDLGIDSEGRVYFTMKLVKGRDLTHIFELVFAGKEGWNETRALSVILRACEALAYAHRKGVIHRDLKPGNIMVGGFGEVYVMDWGVARVLGRRDLHDIRIAPQFPSSVALVQTERHDKSADLSDAPFVTMDGDVMGTPAYMSPEQARGEIEKLGPRSDVYSIGALLYHLLARRAPYAQVSGRAVLRWVLEGPPARLSDLRDDAPAELVAICEKAMSRDATERYADTLALAEDLRAYLEHRVVGAYETGTWAEAKKWIQRNKPLAASLAAAVALLVVGLAASLIFKARSDENARLAEERRRAAEMSAAEAQREKSNVLRLSAFQTLDDLTSEADALWPAEPALLDRYRNWMKKAEALVAKLPVFRAALVEIEARALPQTEDERAADRQSHPRSAELARKRSQLEWQSRMLGEIPWPSPASAETEIARDTSPADASALNVRAWRLVDPEDPVHGSEEKALLLSRRAVALAPDATRAEYRDTLAWALFRLGRLDDALAEERRALEEAGPSKRVEFEGYAAKLESAVNRWRGDARSKRVEERESAEREVAAIEAEVSKRRAWGFANDDDRWWRAQMEKLIGALTAFADERNGLYRGLFAEHGWSIARRLEFASSIEERSVSGAEARAQWSEAIAAIRASKRYAGLQLAPQVGLVPLGMDPVSRLWEFAHLQTGDAPQRGADGKLILTEATGLVFVLVPGTSFDMGAQSADPDAANYDPQARDEESPVHQVTLSPYFLSKYEMTQAQWLRTTGRNPSSYSPVDRLARLELNLLHPVEQVTWLECDQVMSRLGLRLPSEAQWENGCRAGTDSPWWTGSDRETLRGQVNLADQAGARGGATWQEIQDWPDLDDGFAVHAPVGSFAPNPFGLHEVHANVWEWCADGKGAYAEENPIDPLAPAEGAHDRVCRGGSFQNAAALARSSIRDFGAPALQHDSIGLRPARVLVR